MKDSIVNTFESSSTDDEYPEHREAIDELMTRNPEFSEEDARHRVHGQESRALVKERAASEFPDEFGGAWYDEDSDVLHVIVTSMGIAPEISKIADEEGVQVHIEGGIYSLVDLDKIAFRLEEGKVPGIPALDASVGELWNDFPANGWVLHLEPGSDSERIAAAVAKEFPDGVVRTEIGESSGAEEPDVCTSRLACGQPARSGVVISVNGSNSCSLGYRASASDGSKWVYTAGHCAGLNDAIGHGAQAFGPVRLRSYTPGGFDFLRARIDNSYWLISGGGYQYNAREPENPTTIDYAISATSTIGVGDPVCLNAWHSIIGTSCGFVTQVNTSTGRVKTNFDACPGDSGGAWTWRTTSGAYWAYGLHSSSLDNSCHASGGFSYFISVPRINAFNDANSTATVRVEVR
ncbi:MAG: S1 family peptidase [Microbacterium sp.]